MFKRNDLFPHPIESPAQEIAQQVERLRQAQKAYYNGSTPLMSDAEFDRQEERLRDWQPEHPYFDVVGIDSENIDKVTHRVAMLSMDKARQVSDVAAWFQRLLDNSPLLSREIPLCVQPKIDGISASCCYRDGTLQYLATRGDGSQGQNISHIAPFVTDIPTEIPQDMADFEIRGELYLPKDDPTTGPLRNICAGLIHRKEPSPEELRHLRFIAYQCPQQRLDSSEYHQLQLLARLGFHTVVPKLCTIAQLESYVQLYLNELREAWRYETDGLIICLDDSKLFEAIDALWVVNHHHHYTIALKPPAESGTTLLREVHWQLGRQGRLSPVAEFLPLYLSSAIIERASLHNYANVKRLKIQRADVLEVERAGDVIPYVRRNLGSVDEQNTTVSEFGLNCHTDSGPLSFGEARLLAKQMIQEEHRRTVIPQQCPSCSGPLSERGVDLICLRRDCPEQVVQRILFWVKQAGMEQVAQQSIRHLCKQGKLRGLQDLYNLNKEDLCQIPGYAEKKITRFLSELENSRHLNIHQLVERLGIPMVQQKSLQKIGELRRKSRWEYFIRQVAEEWSERQNATELRRTLQEIISRTLPSFLTTDSYSSNEINTNENSHKALVHKNQDWEVLSSRWIDALLESLEQKQATTPEKGLPNLWQLWNTQTGRNEIRKKGLALWQSELGKEFDQKTIKKENNARWKVFIEQIAQLWAAKESERQLLILEDAMLAAFAEVLPDWLGKYDKAGFVSQFIDILQKSIFEPQELGQNLPALLRLWSSQSGHNELWKKGAAAWQEILLAQQPDYLELCQIEDFTNFRETPSRYSVLENLSQWVTENQVLLQELLPILDLQSARGKQGKANICMTGSGSLPRKQLQEKLEAAGYQVSSSLNRSTDILLCADLSTSSGKMKKAVEWGIIVYSYEEFLANLP